MIYGNQKATADSIGQMKQKNREQLAQLLITKFKNKFDVASFLDGAKIDKVIAQEVLGMLAEGVNP